MLGGRQSESEQLEEEEEEEENHLRLTEIELTGTFEPEQF
jgi:hypothetical protein